ncbi:hypothetical protein [Methylocapsa acidiphila]|uniref:hypothetical protein n=1 Tax=Methylocapsa acidiphila TaxID=133552 RepID=UPI00040709E8|nr:hypothetical protein [Methylocapsa acidiphila]
MLVTGNQLAAARALAGVGLATLAKAANVSEMTIRDMEACGPARLSGSADDVLAVQNALEKIGVEFLNHGRPGVRLGEAYGKGAQAEAIAVEDLNAENDE